MPSPFLTVATLGAVPCTNILPGVCMPMMNFGDEHNHSLDLSLGVTGLDTALVYGDKQQKEVGAAVRAAVAGGMARSDIFVTSKIPCTVMPTETMRMLCGQRCLSSFRL